MRWFGSAVVRSDRTRDFFKRRWLQRILSPKKQVSLVVPQVETPPTAVRLQLDTREPALAASLAQLGIPFDSVQLGEGDIVITTTCTKRRMRKIVIERKSVEDFYNSIRSNRLFDQIGRIFDSISKSNSSLDTYFVLVLEGKLSPGSTVTPGMYTAVSHMYHSLLLREKIPIIRTDSVSETARLAVSLGSRMSKLFASPNDFASLVHVERSGRKVNGLNVPYIKLLMSIKGISANRANAIASAYPTMDALVSFLKIEGGSLKLAQLVCPSSARAVGSSLGMATALNVAEAVLGPSHPEVSEFKLVRWLMSQPEMKLVHGEALRLGRDYRSIPGLRLAYLNASLSRNEIELSKIPEQVQLVLGKTVDDPAVLLTGLKGVRQVSTKTAELITDRFVSVRGMHAELAATCSREEAVTLIRMAGTGIQKRLIARTGVDNLFTWLESEGFILISGIGNSN